MHASASKAFNISQSAAGKGELLYSSGGTAQSSFTCPFDFTKPLPADSDGKSLTYSECLKQHGRALEKSEQPKWMDWATNSNQGTGTLLIQHVVETWLSTLRRGVGSPCRPSIVTYVCKNDGRVCGGLGDRVRGQNMAFWQAVLSDSFFISQWERPVALEEYLLPAWPTIGFPDIRACLSAPGNASARTIEWYRPQYFNKERMIGFDYLEEWRGADIIESRSNAALLPEFLQAPSVAAALERYRLRDIPLRHLLHTGMVLYMSRPSEYLAAAAEPYLKQLRSVEGTMTVGIHLRVGGPGLADPDRQPLQAARCFVEEAIAQCADAAPRHCAAFLAADSQEGIALVAEGLQAAGIPLVTAAGVITHNDKPQLAPAVPDSDHEALVRQASKTYVDWWMLSQMDALVMSHSGFSFAAAWASAPAMARWMDLEQARSGVCRFLDYNARCRGSRCVGIGLDFVRGDASDELGTYGNMTSADGPTSRSGRAKPVKGRA